jgi:phytol kinase
VLSDPWIGAAMIVGALAAMLGGLEALRRRFAVHPEITRKTAHVGLGLVALSFPALFDNVWPVAAIGLVVVSALAAIRWIPFVGAVAGKVVHGVERRSAGELYFPIAATALFAVTGGDPLLFGIPILTLTLADAIAAVVGRRHGRTRYATGPAPKSLEGSIAFFGVAFLTIHLPLLLLTDTGPIEGALIATTIALLLAVLEAVSVRGTDNLLIPAGGYLLLAGLLDRGAAELVVVLGVACSLVVLVLAAALVPSRSGVR